MSLLANSNAIESGGYNIDRSLRFRSSASAYLNRTQSAGNQTTWTFSAWVKLGLTGGSYIFHAGASSGSGVYYDASAEELQVEIGNGTTQYYARTSASFRDFSAWYHVLCVADTSNATSTDRLRIYVNGVRQTIGTSSYPTSGFAGTMCQNATASNIGKFGGGSSAYFDGYLAEVNFIDGQALTPFSFGEFSTETGVWVPKKYTGTYGTNGFYLDFKDNTSATTLAYDKSGNGNNWTPNNISTTAGSTYDSMLDVPTLTSASAANFAVLNPLNVTTVSGNGGTFSNGNLTITSNSGAFSYKYGYSTIGVTSGKWYAEITVDTQNATTTSGLGAGSGGIVFTSSTFPSGTIVGLALDADSNELKIYKNGVLHATQSGLGSQTYHFYAGPLTSGANEICQQTANFGQRPFSYTPPTGFKALNTFNLPDPVIKKPNQYMDATLYTGTGATQSITNAAGFQPDFVWTKKRSNTGGHGLFDSVRGQNPLGSNNTADEATNAQYGRMSSYNANGFTVMAGTAGAFQYDITNANGETYVGWQWKKGATPGFDIVTYTGNATARDIPHNLGVAPKFIIVKDRSNANPWPVYHASLGVQYYTLLNATDASYNNLANYWGSTSPTASVFSVNSYGGNNANGDNFVAYLFAEIAGFSKFGSYTGNGSADGPFVYCGFRPKYVMVKRTDSTSDWGVYDSARDTYNQMTDLLFPNASYAETAGYPVDFLSNGFKMRNSAGFPNNSGGTFIFAAFAENPMKYSLAK